MLFRILGCLVKLDAATTYVPALMVHMEATPPPPASITSPVVTVTLGMMLQMLLQIGLQAIVSRQLGAGLIVDAYEGAVAIPLVLSSMISLPLGAVLIPIVTRTRANEGEPAAWTAAGSIGIFVAWVTFALAFALVVARNVILPALYDLSPLELSTATGVMPIVAWLIPANAFVAYSQALHHWRGRFGLPALAGVIGPLVTVGVIVATKQVLTVQLLAEALLAGAVTNVAIQFPPLLRSIHWRFSLRVSNAAARLTGPVLLGAIYWRIDPLIDRSIGFTFDPGTNASLGYCSRITNALAALAAGGLSVVAFPRMSAAASHSNEELARETSNAIGASLLILIPLATAWFVFGDAIIRDLFEGGLFTPADTARVALYVRCAIGVVIGGSVGEILGRTFFAQHDTLVPTLIGTACITAGFGLKWIFSRTWGPAGVLIASSLAMTASAAIQYVVLRQRLGRTLRSSILTDAVPAGMATTAACLAGGAVLWSGPPFPAFLGGLAGLAVYLGSLYFLRFRPRRHPD